MKNYPNLGNKKLLVFCSRLITFQGWTSEENLTCATGLSENKTKQISPVRYVIPRSTQPHHLILKKGTRKWVSFTKNTPVVLPGSIFYRKENLAHMAWPSWLRGEVLVQVGAAGQKSWQFVRPPPTPLRGASLFNFTDCGISLALGDSQGWVCSRCQGCKKQVYKLPVTKSSFCPRRLHRVFNDEVPSVGTCWVGGSGVLVGDFSGFWNSRLWIIRGLHSKSSRGHSNTSSRVTQIWRLFSIFLSVGQKFHSKSFQKENKMFQRWI